MSAICPRINIPHALKIKTSFTFTDFVIVLFADVYGEWFPKKVNHHGSQGRKCEKGVVQILYDLVHKIVFI